MLHIAMTNSVFTEQLSIATSSVVWSHMHVELSVRSVYKGATVMYAVRAEWLGRCHLSPNLSRSHLWCAILALKPNTALDMKASVWQPRVPLSDGECHCVPIAPCVQLTWALCNALDETHIAVTASLRRIYQAKLKPIIMHAWISR